MNYDHDVGSIDTILVLDTRQSPPLGGLVNSLQILGSGSLFLPVGTTAQRPDNAPGQVRFNTETSLPEYNNGTVWSPIGSGTVTSVDISTTTGLSVTGGPITVSGTFALSLDTALQQIAANTTVGFLAFDGDDVVVRQFDTPVGQLVIQDANGAAGNPVISLAEVGTPIANSFVKFTTDANGRVTATTTVTTSDITALVDATYVNVSGDTMSSGANLTFVGGGTVTGLPTPVNASDAATKAYVDAIAQGMDPKQSVRLATSSNVTLGTSLVTDATIDDVTLVAGDRVLVKNQSDPSENGVYVVQPGGAAPIRSLDMDSWDEVPGAFFFVEEGTANHDTGWVCISDRGGVVDTDPMLFTQFSGAGTYTAGNGLTLTGSEFALASPVSIANGGTALSTTPTAGQLLIGNGVGYTQSTLTAGTGITITNASGAITIEIDAADTVTSVTGTANQITASPTSGDVVLSTPTTFIAPGTIASVGTITAGTHFIATDPSMSLTAPAGQNVMILSDQAQPAGSATGSSIILAAGMGGVDEGPGGAVTLQGGIGGQTGVGGEGGGVTISAGASGGTAKGGDVTLQSGPAAGSGGAGGNIVLSVSGGTGGGANGNIIMYFSGGTLQLEGQSGAVGQALASNGPSAPPTWQAFQAPLVLIDENPSGSPTPASATGNNAIALGASSQATGISSVAIGGSAEASAEASVAVGNGAVASAPHSVAVGQGAETTLYGVKAFANNPGVGGSAQYMVAVLKGQTVNATQTQIYLDGVSEILEMPPLSAWVFEIQVIARRTDAVGGAAGYVVSGVARRDASAASITVTGAIVKSLLGETNKPWDVNVDANTANGSVRVRVTGEANKTIDWVASARITQVVNV